MNHLIETGYVVLEVEDPAAFGGFLTDIIGLEPGDTPADGSFAFRMDERVHRVLLREGPANDAAVVGFDAVDVAAFDKVAAQLAGAGFDVAQGTADEISARSVDDLMWTTAPWGVRVELTHGLAEGSPFSSDRVPGGFVTNGMGFGHLVFATMNYDESRRFVTEGLGMAQTDWIETELAPGLDLVATFYHCNPRHHSLAIGKAPLELPQALHHLMVEVTSLDEVGRALDRVWDSDLGISQGIGRHGNDLMTSFYVTTPAGFQMEFGYGARTVSDDWDENRMYDAPSVWGHRPVARG
jgi:2,3-dihydroxybiphenyl 1,2-dioxygenase